MWVQLVIAIIMLVVSVLIRPKVKAPQPTATQDLESPTADAGRPVPVVFGTITVKGLNVLWYGELSQQTVEIRA